MSGVEAFGKFFFFIILTAIVFSASSAAWFLFAFRLVDSVDR